jgi:dTMP kinase
MTSTDTKTIDGGLFITLEGPDAAGKSTQQTLLADALTQLGYDVLVTREPGGTKIGEELRNLVKYVGGDDAPCDEAELFMFSAARAQLTRKVLLPHLLKGGVVLCDRYADSTTAYQGYGRGLDLEMIMRMHDIAVGDRWPDATVLIDVDPRLSRKRNDTREETQGVEDRFEDAAIAFHERVRNGYLTMAAGDPRFLVVDGTQSIDAVHADVRRVLADAIEGLC